MAQLSDTKARRVFRDFFGPRGYGGDCGRGFLHLIIRL